MTLDSEIASSGTQQLDTKKQAQDNLERELTACEQTLAETAKQAQTAAARAETCRRKAEQAQNDFASSAVLVERNAEPRENADRHAA